MADYTDILNAWIAVGMPYTVGLASAFRDNDVYVKDRVEEGVQSELMLANLTARDAPGTTWAPWFVRYGNDRWVLAGDASSLYTGDPPFKWPGVSSWTIRTGSVGNHHKGEHQGGTSQNWVISATSTGTTGVIYSTNSGTTWTEVDNKLAGAGFDVTYASNLWVCVGHRFKKIGRAHV